MTGRATFGDFASAASTHLDNAVPRAGQASMRREAATRTTQTEAFTASLRGVVEVMASYLADITAPLAGVSPQERHLLSPWARAGLEAQDALGHTAAFLPPGRPDTARLSQPGPAGPARGGLDAAASSMSAGRDLLHTHAAAGPDDGRDHSEWAPVVTSVPVTRALLLQVGSWARQLASQGAVLTLSRAPVQRSAGGARRRLSSACQWLWVLDSAIQAAHRSEPVSAEDERLLQAIPVNAVPAHRVPDGTETVPGLCEGAMGSAERVRRVTWRLTPQAAWSRGLTVDSLRQSAGCGTVISHHCEILLRSLAVRAAGHGDAPLSAGLLESADACAHARDAWLRAARGWGQMTTDTRGVISPAAAEAADLALWTGRLAYADPAWTLAVGPSQATRSPETLAAGPGDLPRVVAAVHYACQTLTQIAAADQEQIRRAANAGRLLVPTRSLPATVDIPRAFGPAPRGRVDQVLLGYQDAATTSTRATATVADVATAVGAPSQILTTARAAVHASSIPASRTPPAARPEAMDGAEPAARPEAMRGAQPAARPEAMRWRSRDTPGPIERTLQDLGITSHTVLLRAAAIDQAGEQLILDNQQAAAARRRRLAPTDPNRSAATGGPTSRILASANPRAAAVPRPPAPAPAQEAEAEP